MTPTAVLFDLDDTLCDRAAGLRRYADRLAVDFGACDVDACHKALETCDDFGSMAQAEALSLAAIWHEAPPARDLKAHWDEIFGWCAVFFDGAAELLALLRRHGVQSGVITNGESRLQRSKLAALKLDQLTDLAIVSSEVGVAKPDPAIFHLALAKLGCQPDAAWFVGDHPETDVRGAEVAGLRAFWVRTGAHRDRPCSSGTPLLRIADLAAYLPRRSS